MLGISLKFVVFREVVKEEIEKVENKPINLSNSHRSGGMTNPFHCDLC